MVAVNLVVVEGPDMAGSDAVNSHPLDLLAANMSKVLIVDRRAAEN